MEIFFCLVYASPPPCQLIQSPRDKRVIVRLPPAAFWSKLPSPGSSVFVCSFPFLALLPPCVPLDNESFCGFVDVLSFSPSADSKGLCAKLLCLLSSLLSLIFWHQEPLLEEVDGFCSWVVYSSNFHNLPSSFRPCFYFLFSLWILPPSIPFLFSSLLRYVPVLVQRCLPFNCWYCPASICLLLWYQITFCPSLQECAEHKFFPSKLSWNDLCVNLLNFFQRAIWSISGYYRLICFPAL